MSDQINAERDRIITRLRVMQTWAYARDADLNEDDYTVWAVAIDEAIKVVSDAQ